MTEATQSDAPAPNRRKFLLGAAVVGVGGLTFAYRDLIWKPVFEGRNLTVTQAHDQSANGDIILIDIRRPDEWKRTGVGEGAHPLDMRRKDFIEALKETVGPDNQRPIALMCARGVRSARMSQKLTSAGFDNIVDVPEGMLGSRAGPGWLKTGLPTVPWSEPSQ